MSRHQILLVEDNPADVRLFREFCTKGFGKEDVAVVMDGDAAIDYLDKRGQFAGVSTPQLVFLDLNLPKRSGFEVLEHIKSTEGLRLLPVIIFSTSGANPDIQRSYDLNAACYVKKPQTLEEFDETCSKLHRFWLEVVTLPSPNTVEGAAPA